jgi:nitrogen fixation/metabolism regulation signal transduction histidine kinase
LCGPGTATQDLNARPHGYQARQLKEKVNTMIDLETLMDNLPIAIFLIGRDGRVLLTNRVAEKNHCIDLRERKVKRFGDMVGCPNASENNCGCGLSEFCHLCRIKEKIDRAFTAKESIAPFEADTGTGSMGARSLRVTATYIGVAEGLKEEQEMCIVTVEDLTELKKKERLAAASETIGAICHEMNQPLQAIMGNVELLAKFQLEEGAVSKIEKIFSEMERIKSINSKLMNLTHYQTKPYLSTNILDVERAAG